jgi:hypothetical protein
MTIDAAQSAIRLVIANALVENVEASGRGFDALRQLRFVMADAQPAGGYGLTRFVTRRPSAPSGCSGSSPSASPETGQTGRAR